MRPTSRALQLVVCAALVATSSWGGATSVDATGPVYAAPPVITPPPTGDDPWLATINWWRSFGAAVDGSPFPTVTNVAADNTGPKNHVDYLVNIWTKGSTYCNHFEDPAFPKTPGVNYWHNVLFCGMPTLTAAVDGWMNTPYHGEPLLDPSTARVGAARNATPSGTSASAALIAATNPISTTYVWPKNGGVVPRTRWWGGESPDPTAVCAPETGSTLSQPVFAFFPQTRRFVSSTVTSNGAAVPHCALGLTPSSQVRSVTIMAKRPWVVGATVTATVTTTAVDGSDRQTLTWSYTVAGLSQQIPIEVVSDIESVTVTVPEPTADQTGGLPIDRWTLQVWRTNDNVSSLPTLQIGLPGPGQWNVHLDAGYYHFCLVTTTALGTSRCSQIVSRSVTAASVNTAAPAGTVAPVGTAAPVLRVLPQVPVEVNSGAESVTVTVPEPTADQSGGLPIDHWNLRVWRTSDSLSSPPRLQIALPGPGQWNVRLDAGHYHFCLVTTTALGTSRCLQIVSRSVTAGPFSAATPVAGFEPVDPVRLLDTREPGAPVSRLRANEVATLDLRTRAPQGTVAVALNLTATGTAGDGFVRVYPCTAAATATSNLNPVAARVTTNAAVVAFGDGRICLQSMTDTDLVVDLNGWLTTSATAGLVITTPERLLDTRTANPISTRLSAGQEIAVPVVAPDSTATAVTLNVTAADPAADGYVTAYPCGTQRPLVSNLNPTAGVTAPNLVNVRVGDRHSVCFFTTVDTDLVIDKISSFEPGAPARFAPIDPIRHVDTRGRGFTRGPDGAGLVTTGPVVALQANLTAVDAFSPGWLATYACADQKWPGTSNVNYPRLAPAANAALMPASADTTCVRSSSNSSFIVDVFGVWKVAHPANTLSP